MNESSYNKWASMTDQALIEKIGVFIKHHRLNQNKSQHEVAKDANMSRSTLSLLERGEKVSLITLIKILRVLDLLFVMDAFEVENEISPIEYAKLKKNKRKRAGKKDTTYEVNEDLEW